MLFVAPALSQTVPDHPETCWWCARESFNLNDPEKVWSYLTADITVLNTDIKTPVYLLDAPNGSRLKKGQYAGFLYGSSVSVHVLSVEDSWARIEGYDMTNDLIEGYVRASLLKTITPSDQYGVIVDKQTQRLHLYQDGKELTQLLVSTGLPEKDKPFNETKGGEYLLSSWTGGFWSGNMYCDMGIRFNGGDLLHLVPALINKRDGSYNFAPFEPLLGNRASHGCIRVQRVLSPEGFNMKWLWDNLKRNTKMIVWDDSDRPMFYPDPNIELFYNTNKGQNYHVDQYCRAVKDQWLPLTPIKYSDLRVSPYNKLTACKTCVNNDAGGLAHPYDIDRINEERGFTREQAEAAQAAQAAGMPITINALPNAAEIEDFPKDEFDPNAIAIVEDVLTIDDGEWSGA